ncbi:MAG: hypothetical protein ILM98_13960 [Kiritimatiellae bacterium]|nr:hypothetical protein [Kiritimatiellia bacterium]
MAFGVNLTGCPITVTGGVLQSASTQPRNHSLAEALDERGNTAARTLYGGDDDIKTVTVTYALKSGTFGGSSNKITIGKTNLVESVKVTTSNGAWPTIEVTYHDGETSANGVTVTGDDFELAFPEIEALKVAQPLMVSVGTGAKLTGSSITFKCDRAELQDDHGALCATAYSHGTLEVTADAVAVTADPSFTFTSPAAVEEFGGLSESNTAYGTSSAKGSGYVAAVVASNSNT